MRYLMIWEFVGCVSAINGLLCFTLSSTYKLSFGKLGFGGLLVYLLFGLFMWCLILWAKRIRVEVRFQGLVKALIFVVLCSISVLLDKLETGRSDALSIISYASFALMSLSMSRKSELGFETGFFTFFLSLFFDQLCKINLKLSPIAFVFCLVVIILRHSSESGVRFGSITPNGYHHRTEVDPSNAAVIDIGDEDIKEKTQYSPGMGEASEQSLLSTNISNNVGVTLRRWPLQLVVRVIEARNLSTKNYIDPSGLYNPYVRIQLGGQRLKTKVAPRKSFFSFRRTG